MTEMRIILPENDGCPIVVEHEDFLIGDLMNLKFDRYELNYGSIDEECHECGGLASQITVKDGDNIVFNMDFYKHWILFLDIESMEKLYKISIKIHNMDDGDTCETCENNRYHFQLTSLVDSYTFYQYSAPKGEYKQHPIIPDEEFNEEIKNDMK